MLNIKEKLINISSIRVEYENGVYCGCHNGFSKEGIGCFYSDDNMIYIGIYLFF